MKFEGFIGPSAESRSPNVNAERTINLYLEAGNEGGANPKVRNALYGTPGLVLFGTLPTTPVRGLWAGGGRLFAVGGDTLYEVSNAGAILSTRGFVGNDGNPVQFFANGNQLLIVSNGTAYCDNGAGPVALAFSTALTGTVDIVHGLTKATINWKSGDQFLASMQAGGGTFTIAGVGYTVGDFISPTQINIVQNPANATNQPYSFLPPLSASVGAFLDGYFIVAPPNYRQINISAINDGTSWSGLDFAIKEGYPDAISALLADHEELWIFGTDTTEIWQNTGAASFPLARIGGAFIHRGCAAKFSPVRLLNGVAWLSRDPVRGGVVAYLTQGFTPQRVSTHAEETVWDGYSTIADAVSFTYTEDGHEFWVITFPAANATHVFDATSGTWTYRGWWNGASQDRQRQMFHAYVFGKHIVGDWSNGKLYQQSVAILDDAGTAIHWERTAPHLSQEQMWLFYSRFMLDMEVGQSLAAPSVSLSYSDDGGHTFSTPVAMTPDKATFAGRMFRNRLGRARDRIFRMTGVSGATRVALLQALLEVSQGTS